MHRDTTPEGVPDHDDARLHLNEHCGDCIGILGRAPNGLGSRSTPEARQVEGDRVDARRKDPVEVAMVPSPSVQGEDRWRARAIPLTEQSRAGEGGEHFKKS
jgi:hypothetical protein